MWTLAAFGHHEDRMPKHGYEATREAAMAALVKSWRYDDPMVAFLSPASTQLTTN
jgi:hypothetical protein